MKPGVWLRGIDGRFCEREPSLGAVPPKANGFAACASFGKDPAARLAMGLGQQRPHHAQITATPCLDITTELGGNRNEGPYHHARHIDQRAPGILRA